MDHRCCHVGRDVLGEVWVVVGVGVVGVGCLGHYVFVVVLDDLMGMWSRGNLLIGQLDLVISS